MNPYRAIGRAFRAYSVMTCDGGYGKPITEHDPHSWNSEHTIYGAYFCPGRINGKPREDFTREDVTR